MESPPAVNPHKYNTTRCYIWSLEMVGRGGVIFWAFLLLFYTNYPSGVHENGTDGCPVISRKPQGHAVILRTHACYNLEYHRPHLYRSPGRAEGPGNLFWYFIREMTSPTVHPFPI